MEQQFKGQMGLWDSSKVHIFQGQINFCKLFLSWKCLSMASDFPIEYLHLVQQLLIKDQELISRKQQDGLLIFTSSKSNNIKPAS